MKKIIYLSLGTNLGERRENLKKALDQLEKEGVKILEKSKIYETAPMHVTNQPKFLNMAVKAECDCEAEELLKICKKIEKEMGRKKGLRYGPRIIDIDILFFGDEIVELENLIIPHSRIQERVFVLQPLCEIDPQIVHPVLGETVESLLSRLV